MNTVCSVNAFKNGTDKLYDELFARLAQIESDFSADKPTSQISQINAAAGLYPVAVSADVLYVIRMSLVFAKLSDGAFDPTVGPLVKLWGINTDHARVPAQSEIDALLPDVDWTQVRITTGKKLPRGTIIPQNIINPAGSVFLPRKGMALDMGGIAKGFAADELVSILKKHKVKQAVIDLGGNVYVFGTKADKTQWRVGIKDPDDPEGSPGIVLDLDNSSVVTSGVYERFFIQNGKRYHHILNPKTGYPAENGLKSVTIICESSITADALSTGVFILGKERGEELVRRIAKAVSEKEDADAVTKNGSVTDGMGSWLYTDDTENVSDEFSYKDLPVIKEIPSLHTGLAVVFIADDRRITASKELSSVISVSGDRFAEPTFR